MRMVLGVSVCPSGTMSPATSDYAQLSVQPKVRTAMGNIINMAFSLKMLCSNVMA